ncbi:DUF2977 domain-containing protein [Latilactobacillus sakei]|uniref:DUF2977 domain-containing protein n=1 Tax=Latilactobacillus sakei TaxID=1599 RepID=UPI000C12977C|nr:DUF2977 domain-containing protein [Latilactobacillus sakei]SON70929.1 conserved protein of unknown function [Latilactobacillus sakei]
MQIAVNDRDEIIEFATIGGLPDAVEFTGNIPDGFITDFKPTFFMLKKDTITNNPDYVQPVSTAPEVPTGPTTEQVMINQLGLQVAELTTKVNQLEGGAVNG